MPRELRDHIYGFLLDAAETQYIPTPGLANDFVEKNEKHGTAGTYHYHTNILAVNKTISAEARQVLIEKNRFVVVKYKCPGLIWTLHQHDVPIVVVRDTILLPDCALSVSLEWPTPPFVTIKMPEYFDLSLPSSKETGTVLMLGRDLPRFIELLRFLCQDTLWDRVYVLSERGANIAVKCARARSKLKLALAFFNTPARREHNDTQHSLLRPFKTAYGAGFDLTINGVPDEAEVTAIKKAMSPPLIWLRALVWDRYDATMILKERADRYALSGDLSTAAERYSYMRVNADTEVIAALGPPKYASDSEVVSAYQQLCLLELTNILSLAWINFRRGYVKVALDDMNEALAGDLPKYVTWQSYTKLGHIFIMSMITGSNTPVGTTQLRQGVQDMTRDMGIYSQKYDDDVHMAHDAQLLKDVMSVHGPDWRPIVDLHATSACALPTRTFELALRFPTKPRADTLVGWMDTAHLAELSVSNKKTILALQQKRGLPVTEDL